MLARLIGLFVATIFLLSVALSGALASFADCGGETRGDLSAEAAAATSHTTHHVPLDAEDSDRAGKLLGEGGGCHGSGSGCPGCLAPADLANAAPNGYRVSYLISAQLGGSSEPAGSFRPPRAFL